MKKALLLLIIFFAFGNVAIVKAQCYGNVVYDQTASPTPTSSSSNSFTISTTHCNELIMISYDGFDFGSTTGTGPITVDGNPATYLNTSSESQGGIYVVASETYAYLAPAIGSHTILVNENGYSATSGYDINFAADFYAINTVNPLTVASLTSAIKGVPCASNGPITGNINTTIPNSMIYSNTCYNDVTSSADPITWINANFLGDNHGGDGIEAADAYTSATAPGPYAITATNSSNSSYCTGITMVLVAIPPPLCGNPLTATDIAVQPACGGNNGSITVNASGGYGPYTYTWSPNINTTNIATGLSAGTYSIIVSDANCNVCNPDPLIVILTGPVLTIAANVNSNDLCFGNCNGSATCTFTSASTPFTYAWTPSGGSNATATGLCAGNYTVTATDHNGCSKTATITITQPTQLTANTVGTNVLCFGGTGSIAAAATGGTVPYTYDWAPAGGTSATATGITAGSYTVTVTDNNGCTATASSTITQPTVLAVSLTGPQTICSNTIGTLTATVSGGSVPYTYAWSSGITSTTSTAKITPVVAQTYTVNITDKNGCTTSAQIFVTLGPPIFVSITGGTYMCSGMSTTLCASATGGTGGITFQWTPGNVTTPCVTVLPTATTTYTVAVSDTCGTTTTASVTVNINPAPNVAFGADLYQGCAPLCIQFYNTTTLSQGGAATYLWDFGDGDTTHHINPIYCYPNSGTYAVTLTVTSDSGCSATLKKPNLITAFTHPIAAFTTSPYPVTILAPTVQFTDASTDPNGLISWFWNFGDETDSTSYAENPTHTYQDTGKYCASLVVMNTHGCTDTATNCLIVDPIFNLYIPSAFSPNGDSKNPTFEPKGQYIKSFEMYIFDRWGMLLCHTTDIKTGWNGTVSGGSTVAQEDTYIYKILVTDSRNKQHSYVGNVTLVR